MPQIHLDHLSALSGKMERGAIRSVTRTARLIFSAEELDDENEDIRSPEILSAALDALEEEGFVFGSLLNEANTRWSHLVLVGMEPKLAMSDSQNCVDVTLSYQHVLDGANQFATSADSDSITVPSGRIWGKYRTGIVEKTTNFFYPNGDRSNPDAKTLIVVSYTVPTWDIRVGGIPHDPNHPRTIYQGGEITIPFPNANYRFELVVSCIDPVKLANTIRNRINTLPWLGYDSYTWICSNVEIEMLARDGGIIGPDRSLYKFAFEFQHNNDGWKPTVVFNDQQSGKPPAGVDEQKATIIDDNGVLRLRADPYPQFSLGNPLNNIPAAIWQVPALRELNFDAYFNNCQFEAVVTAVDYGG